MATTDQLPVIDGRRPIILEAIGGGFCIAAGDIAAHLYKDGKWKFDSDGENDSADEWAWPTREAAEQFLRSVAAPPVVKERLTEADASKLCRVTVNRDDEGYWVVPWYRLKDGKVVSIPPEHPLATFESATDEFNRIWREDGR